MKQFLVDNTFPFSLIRHSARVTSVNLEKMKAAMKERTWASFWGHENTVDAASSILCQDIRPSHKRPALSLSKDGLPSLDGHAYAEAWILSAEFTKDFRPQIGEEIPLEKIKGWQVLQIEWTHA